MSMQFYVPEYRALDSATLRNRLKSLEGQEGIKPAERASAIRRVLHERSTGEPAKDEPETTIEKTFEELLAERYLAKSQNARERGLKFELTLSDFRRLYKRKCCFYSGMRLNELSSSERVNVGADRTLDRIDPSKGYTRENVVMCSNAINQIKNHIFENEKSSMRLTKKELQRFANWAATQNSPAR